MVGVDWPIKALSMHIQKPYKGIIVEVLTAAILSKTIVTKLLHAYVQCVPIMSAKYQIVPSKLYLVGVDQPMKAQSMHKHKPN